MQKTCIIIRTYARRYEHLMHLENSLRRDRLRFDQLESGFRRNHSTCTTQCTYDLNEVEDYWVGSGFCHKNGVKQGGLLSPIVISIVIYVLLCRLRRGGVGCHVVVGMYLCMYVVLYFRTRSRVIEEKLRKEKGYQLDTHNLKTQYSVL